MLRAALNQQNYSQFKMYAQLQCPDNEQKVALNNNNKNNVLYLYIILIF